MSYVLQMAISQFGLKETQTKVRFKARTKGGTTEAMHRKRARGLRSSVVYVEIAVLATALTPSVENEALLPFAPPPPAGRLVHPQRGAHSGFCGPVPAINQ